MSVRRLSPLVRAVLAPNPGPMTLQGTNTYLIGERRPVVLDPGPADDEHLERVAREAGEVSLILLTHRHHDHAEGALRLAEMSGAPLAAAAFAGAHRSVADGDTIGDDEEALRAVTTPGHSSDHLCFALDAENAVFTGDHVLGEGTTVVAYPDGDMDAYLDSLARLREAAPARLYPGHGPVIEDPGAVLDYYVSHRLEREAQVVAALEAGDDSVGAIVARLYRDVDKRLHHVAAMSVRAHLARLARAGRARESDGIWKTR